MRCGAYSVWSGACAMPLYHLVIAADAHVTLLHRKSPLHQPVSHLKGAHIFLGH